MRNSILALIMAATNSAALAAPGDQWSRVEWCTDSGDSGVNWFTGDCESVQGTISSMFPTFEVKGCTDFTENGVAPNDNQLLDMLNMPAAPFVGSLINVGQSPSGVIITFDPGATPSGRGGRLTGIRSHQPLRPEIAPIPLPQNIKADDIIGVQMYLPGAPAPIYPGDLVNNVQGDFELFIHVRDPQDPTVVSRVIRHPINESTLNFTPSTLPCSIGDIDEDRDVDVFDLIFFLQNFTPTDNTTCPQSYCQSSDRDGDGDIDVFDLIAFLQNFNPTGPNCGAD